ncbi:BTB/POZ domain-containing protein 3 [Globodera pallida]|nr:BTB/POZ domain-containing protein 3 [Globodera pallida]
MSTFLFLVAICLLVGASILLETDASPPPKANKKLEKGSSSSGKAQSTPATSNGADVHFLVGKKDKQKLLPAHKAILAKASNVFERMFPFDEENAKAAAAGTAPSKKIKPVEVTDVEVDAFKAMLAFIYAKDLSELNGKNVFSVLYAADKYNIPKLVNSCLNFIWKLNVFFAFDQARFFGKEAGKPIEVIWGVLQSFEVNIKRNADALILSEAFLQIDQQLLCEILDRDELWISEEIAIWNAALRWADEKCHQNEKECSAENRRALLGPALYKIRFPLIPQKDFTEKIVPSGVLEEDEQVGVYQYHSHQDAGLPELYQLQFPTNGRALAGLTPENRWVARHEHLTLIDANELIVQSTGEKNGKHSSVSGSAARAKKLAVIRPAQLIVQFIGENSGNYSVLAEQPIPKENSGIFYYEVTILEEGDGIYIGLATEQMPLNRGVGESEGTYGYGNWGRFWGHEVEGCHHYNGRPFIRDGIPSFGVSDVVGCGVDLETRQIIYTKNGQQLKTTDLKVDSDAELYPCVSLFKPGTKIEANFGTEKFRFDIAKAFEN